MRRTLSLRSQLEAVPCRFDETDLGSGALA